MMNNPQRGRERLHQWEASKPDNFFVADRNLQCVLRRILGEPAYGAIAPDLARFGAACATVIDAAAKQEDQIGNHPQLERWSNLGDRVERIAFHPNHDLIGRLVWESGVMTVQAAPGNTVYQMALMYLLAHNGEAGHACSLACTAGLIRALQTVASDDLKAKFLLPLLERDYSRMQHGAQFLTEIQGGSDVGANAVTAQDTGDGTWRISGEKWFCSNINADQFLIMARVHGEGTRGLGLFLVPRRLDDGSTNGFYLRRLKDKLGTRTLASAEVDFVDAVAYPVGPVDQGFKHTVELVLNTSRLMNAVACAGIMRRAAIEASTYACNREAFGAVIAAYPLVQETVVNITVEQYAAVSSSFALAALVDRLDAGQATDDERGAYRVLVNVNKYSTSVRGTEAVHRAIEVLGGNGAIESFSILPRLYRDMLVLESWEGTHNVLCAQVLRDIARYRVHEPYLRYLRAQLAMATDTQLLPNRTIVEKSLERAQALCERLIASDDRYAQAHMRRLADLLADVGQAAFLLAEAQWELDQARLTIKPYLCTHFINTHLKPDYTALDDGDYLVRLERLMAAL
ncbi:MAG: acyl-CoA dehydrogenase family protein [Anaerolineae bacterium]|nr:acyl-CoA dehydrogenase family protein [Anaerolineae bacterium]